MRLSGAQTVSWVVWFPGLVGSFLAFVDRELGRPQPAEQWRFVVFFSFPSLCLGLPDSTASAHVEIHALEGLSQILPDPAIVWEATSSLLRVVAS